MNPFVEELRGLLELVGAKELSDPNTWSKQQRNLVYGWARQVHLSVDNDVTVPPMPRDLVEWVKINEHKIH